MVYIDEVSIRRKALKSYTAPVIIFLLCCAPFILPSQELDSAILWLKVKNIILFNHYTNLYSASYPDWRQRTVSVYIMLTMSPFVLSSGIYFVLQVVDPYRRGRISNDLRKIVSRAIGLTILFLAGAYACIFIPGMDMAITKSISNAHGIKSSLIIVGEFWALGGICGLLISDLLRYKNGDLMICKSWRY